jgi:hypothetical protein
VKRKTKKAKLMPTEKPELYESTVTNCARCGNIHIGLTFFPFIRPPKYGRTVWTHYAPCPRTHEPILGRRTLKL